VLAAVMPSASSLQGKPALRAAALAARDALPAGVRATASRAIAATVDAAVFAGLPAGATVALYAPKASEVDTAELAARAAVRGLAIAYPRVVRGSRVLAFHRATVDELVPGVFSLREPRAEAPAVALDALAAVVVPGIAFDADGNRIGWGRGYYDATLAVAPSVLSVGIAFATQILPRIPSDAIDVPVRLVITETGIVRAPRAG
jgi:5-formyltetrahydrofolate cyclo-ligase